MIQLPKLPWWRTDTYEDDSPAGGLLDDMSNWGPKGAAVVRLYEKGDKIITDPGWGSETFMKKYNRNDFNHRRLLHQYYEKLPSFAWIMRSSKMICVDIDGKNGGFDHAVELGFLPHTLAEVSQSGNGYHLFYLVPGLEWDNELGFEGLRDVIGLVTGVDIRATGCVYHKPSQRWNNRPIAQAPESLVQKLTARRMRQTAAVSQIEKTLETQDKEMIAIMHDELLEELKKPIPAGRRNQTLFALGSQLYLADVPDWENLIEQKALDIGLDYEEIEKLSVNITRYNAS